MKLITTAWLTALLFSATQSAQALPITDVYTPNGGSVVLTTGTDYSYQHSLLSHGFDPLTDILTNATLTFTFGPQAGGNAIAVTFDTLQTNYSSMNDINGEELLINLSFLQSDGLLDVTLTKGGGKGSTFNFFGSVLLAQGESEGSNLPVLQVPEPTLLALLGIGLLSMGITSRRTKFNRM